MVEKNSKYHGHWHTLKILASYLWPQNRKDLRVRLIVAILFLALAKILNVYVPYLLKLAVDQLSVNQSPLVIPVVLIVSYGVAKIFVSLFGEVRDLVFVDLKQQVQRKIALQTFSHLHNLSLDFHLSRQTGGLSRVIERGTRGIQFVLNFMTFNIVPTLLEIALVTGILVYQFELIYAVIVFTTVMIYILLTLFVTEWRLKFRKEMNSSESRANTKAIDSLINFETVKYFGNEEHEYSRFDQSLKRYERAAIQSQQTLSVLNILQAAVIGIGLIAILLLAGQGVVDEKLTIGDFFLVNTYLMQLYMPLNFLGFVYREIKNSLVDMDKMFELIHINSSVNDKEDAINYISTRGRVEFKNVSFSYNSERPILDNINFTMEAGQTVAVVGPSGAGKSTLSRLLFRFYDVNKGSIEIDGIDIREMSQKSLRQNIGVVPQDTVLFNDTIGYNIAYGNPRANQVEIEQAAKSAAIHEFIESLPDKYETPVGERGLKLSGGEKQRVAISRTLLKNPPILIFDEATSALDSHKEKEIQKSLKMISKNRSTLVIAHRLSTIIDADSILVLVKGRVVEQGTHGELLSLQGEYYRLWHRQQEVEQIELKLEEMKEEETH